jgi:class 3 adenylate cyclase/tetratricopeptide (TPR) repeat protein
VQAAARRRAREAERRQVTLLVCGCELFESEAFLEFEAEDQAESLRRFQRICEQTLQQFDGAVLQCDETLLACFGYPVAREDAASRATEAGLRLLEELKSLGDSSKLDIGAWAGLHTGPAIVETKEDAVSLVGDVRNVAVRMKEFAEPGRLLCTHATRRLFRDNFECTELGEQKIKGLSRPLVLFRVERGVDGALSGLLPDPTPLTGREYEINLLKERWEQARDGMGHVVLLVGEPGLGKSRLVRTLKEHVLGRESDAPVVEWRCSPHHQNTGLHSAADYFSRVLGFRPEESPLHQFDRLLQFVAKHGLDRPDVVPFWASLLSLPCPDRFPAPALPPARFREETFRLLMEWLRVASVRSPILFIVEDLHWVDASTLEFLAQAVAEFPHERVLALFTCRPEFKPPWAAMDHQTSLALTRLTKRQVGELIRRKTGNDTPDDLVDQVYDRAGGVPLFIEEFTKMVQAAGSKSAAIENEIPSTLQDLIMARLDRMESGRDLAQLASVLGREFSHEVLSAVAAVDEPTLQETLLQLAKADILHAKGRAPRCTYIFKHALLEDALYGSLLKPRRQEFHRRIAEAMESRFPQTVETQPEILARHFTGAGLTEKAVEYWLKAGLRSRSRSAFAEAIEQLNQGLALVETLPEGRARDDSEFQFLIALAPACIAFRGYAAPEVGPALVRASQLCQRIGDALQQLGILLGMWEWRIVRGDLRVCEEQAAEGVAIAERAGDPGMMMEALFMPGVTMFYRARFADARVHFENALAKYDDRERTKLWTAHTGHDAGVTHRCYLALVLWHLGHPDQAVRLSREACELAKSVGHAFSLGHAVDFAAFLAVLTRAGDEILARSEEEIAIATEHAFPFWHALGTLHKGAALLMLDRHEEALPLLLKGLASFRGSGAEIRIPCYLGLIGEAFTRLGRFTDAHAALDEALAVVEKNDDRSHEAELHRLRGDLLLAESPSRSSDAEACYRRAIETAQHQQSAGWESRCTKSRTHISSAERAGGIG